EVAVVHPKKLHHFIGPETRAVGISSMDPLGIAYVSLTYSRLFTNGSEPNNRTEFRNLLLNTPITKARRSGQIKVIVGGAGAWQTAPQAIREFLGIDCVITGEGEGVAVDIFRRTLEGAPLPPVVQGKSPRKPEDIPLIRGESVHGCVEITRGCGRGCQFCTPTQRQRMSIPVDRVVQEVTVNASHGASMIVLATEDIFLYGLKSRQFRPNRERIVKLLEAISSVPGIKAIQPAHMALAPVMADPKCVEEIAEILITKTSYQRRGKPYITAEAGVETGSTRLIKERMAGKALPFKPKDWQEIVVQSFGILNDVDWNPLTTWIVGLPGEREEDVLATLELLDRLKGAIAFYVPLLFVPLRPSILSEGSRPEVEGLSELQWEVFTRAWEYNLDIWRRPLSPSPRNLLSSLLLPIFGGLFYLTSARRNPNGPMMKKLLFHSFKKAFLEPG
ncbi:MAG: B12-binding domain-containing radical SAM protein, partial [Promethearchaeota archaeon]